MTNNNSIFTIDEKKLIIDAKNITIIHYANGNIYLEPKEDCYIHIDKDGKLTISKEKLIMLI